MRQLLKDELYRGVLARGYLVKQGTAYKTFRRRYFLLLPRQLRYYTDEGLGIFKGAFSLEGLRPAVSPSACRNCPTRFAAAHANAHGRGHATCHACEVHA